MSNKLVPITFVNMITDGGKIVALSDEGNLYRLERYEGEEWWSELPQHIEYGEKTMTKKISEVFGSSLEAALGSTVKTHPLQSDRLLEAMVWMLRCGHL